jgi:hypothetical protein
MEARYEYEKEGYKLSSGWYLPDFWLTDMKIWLEVKPEGVSCKHNETMLLEQGSPILVTDGTPDRPMSLTCYGSEWYEGRVVREFQTWPETLWAWHGNVVVVPKDSQSIVFEQQSIQGDDDFASYENYNESFGGHLVAHKHFVHACNVAKKYQFDY